jgi:uncharacterized protein YraI
MRATLILACATAALGALAAAPATAASEVTGTVLATAGLNVHSGSPSGPVIDTMPYQSKAIVYCYTAAASVTGPYGPTTTWDAIDGYTPPGGTFVAFGAGTKVYASDAWLYTGKDTSQLVRHC